MYAIRTATPHDESTIAELIARAQMTPPVFGVSGWWVACNQRGVICGTIGAEFGANAWLLRSAVVDTHARGRGVGGGLTRIVLQAARHHGMQAVYCFSTDAGDFWQHMGFTEVPVAALLAALPNVPQVGQFAAFGWLPTEVAWCYTIA